MSNTDRNNVRCALDWFLSFLATDEWSARKAAMEEHLQEMSPIYPSRSVAEMHPPVSTALDSIHWYMYLAENALTSVAKYEPTQGARILPVFARLGAELEILKQVKGAPEKARELVMNRPDLADSTLFEFLVAILWK